MSRIENIYVRSSTYKSLLYLALFDVTYSTTRGSACRSGFLRLLFAPLEGSATVNLWCSNITCTLFIQTCLLLSLPSYLHTVVKIYTLMAQDRGQDADKKWLFILFYCLLMYVLKLKCYWQLLITTYASLLQVSCHN